MFLQELGENPFQKSKTTRSEPIAPSTTYDMVETARTLLKNAQHEFRRAKTAAEAEVKVEKIRRMLLPPEQREELPQIENIELKLEAPLVRFNQNNEVVQAFWQTPNENKSVPFGYDRLGINLIRGSLIIALDGRRQELSSSAVIDITNQGTSSEYALNVASERLAPHVANISVGNEFKFSRKRQIGPEDKGKDFGPEILLDDEDVTLFMNRFYDIAAIHGLMRVNEELPLAS